jgi:hypothetical protein
VSEARQVYEPEPLLSFEVEPLPSTLKGKTKFQIRISTDSGQEHVWVIYASDFAHAIAGLARHLEGLR